MSSSWTKTESYLSLWPHILWSPTPHLAPGSDQRVALFLLLLSLCLLTAQGLIVFGLLKEKDLNRALCPDYPSTTSYGRGQE